MNPRAPLKNHEQTYQVVTTNVLIRAWGQRSPSDLQVLLNGNTHLWDLGKGGSKHVEVLVEMTVVKPHNYEVTNSW